jgi:bifunctional non-homologous end joining protein LigD
MSENTMKMGQYSIELSNLDKKMYPKSGITKKDVIEYYKKISPYMLTHIKQRPLVMHRFPDGIDGEDFYQKAIPDYFPDWINRTKITLKEGGSEYLVVVEKAADLVYLANQACLVPHVWLSREDNVENPDKLVFDLDPSGNDFGEVKFAAHKLKKALEDKGLTSYVMTTGSKGLHVTVPIKPDHPFKKVREFAEELAWQLAKDYPDRLTTESRKVKREGRLLLDYMRNAFGQTSVVPYGLRALPDAPVATPIDWTELKKSQLNPQTYNLNNIFRRLSQKDDPWKDIFRKRNRLKI